MNVKICHYGVVHHRLVLTSLVEAEAHRRSVVPAVEDTWTDSAGDQEEGALKRNRT